MSRSKHLEPLPVLDGCEEGASQGAAITSRRMHPQWNLREMLPAEKVAIYNRRKSPMEHMKMLTDQVYSGLLRFNYYPGKAGQAKSHDMQVTSDMTCTDVLPELRRHFVPHLNGTVGSGADSPGCISLMQGEMERVLDREDKPLEIVLDCSMKGLASPKFIFQPLSHSHRLAPHHTNHFTSYVGALTTSSYPNIAASSSCPTESPHLPTSPNRQQWLSVDGEHSSLQSADSCNNVSGKKAGRRFPRVAKSLTVLQSKSPPRKKKLSHTLSDQGAQVRPGNSSAKHLQQTPLVNSVTASSQGKSASSKTSVGNLITRSLRVNKKSKQSKNKSANSSTDGTTAEFYSSLTLPPMSPEDEEATMKVSSLISPLPVERRFTMSSIMHIYYTDARKAQIYKSVLVSQKASAREVISQALERFHMTYQDPRDFSLFEVIGRWQDVSQSLQDETEMEPGSTASLTNLSVTSGLLAPRPAVTSVEEFVVCYSRELSPEESPYNLQFYFNTQEGYSRRFELRHRKRRSHTRSKSQESREHIEGRLGTSTPKKLSWASAAEVEYRGDSPLFGDTSHRRRGRRSRPSPPLHKALLESLETEEEIMAGDGNGVGEGSGEGSTTMSLLKGEEDSEEMTDGGMEERERKLKRGKKIDGSPEVVHALSPQERVPIHSITSSSPDSGVMNFAKECNHHPDSAMSSANSDQLQLQGNIASTAAASASLQPPADTSPLKTAFLLSLKLHDPEKELLIQPLLASVVHMTASTLDAIPGESTTASPEASSTQHVVLCHPDLAKLDQPLCSIQRKITSDAIASTEAVATADAAHIQYMLHFIQPALAVCINGQVPEVPSLLHHGDILSISDDCYLFLFQDYSSLGLEHAHQVLAYGWRPTSSPPPSLPTSGNNSVDSVESGGDRTSGDGVAVGVGVGEGVRSVRGGLVEGVSKEGAVSLHTTEEKLEVERVLTGDTHTPTAPALQPDSSPNSPKALLSQTSQCSSTGSAVELSGRQDIGCQTPTPTLERRHGSGSEGHGGEVFMVGSVDSLHMKGCSTPIKSGLQLEHRSPKHAKKHRHRSSSSSSLSTPSSSPLRKTLFSFNLSEEGALLKYLVTDLDSSSTPCHLGPALILAMCTEYCLKCHGPAATSRFLQRAVDCVQEVVWDCTRKLTQWQPDPSLASSPLSHCEVLFPLLQPAVFWLANGLELHHLITHSCSPLSNPEEDTGDNPVNILHNILVYIFQQMFYTVSKVLYQSLPLVLDSCGGEGKGDEIVEQAVDFLQALLDLMTEAQLHLQVVSCFYANLFFFINTCLLNSLLKLGAQQSFFQHGSGTVLRVNLSLLEGWACQVGFKEAVLHHLARLSCAVDLLATPPQCLVEMHWEKLRDEYPVLHPSQLHLLLSHYTPPSPLTIPTHWTPSPSDTSSAYDKAMVSESFDCHPGFQLPADSYTLDLNKPSPEPQEFQVFMEALRKSLKQPKKSVDIMPVVESKPSARVPTLLTNVGKMGHEREGKDVEEEFDGRPRKGSTTKSTFYLARSHNSLDDLSNNHSTNGIGSNTESQEDLLDTHSKNLRNQQEKRMGVGQRRPHSGSKIASLISSYEETAKLSQSPPQSPKRSRGSLKGKRERVGRVMSIVAPQSYAKPEKLVLEVDEDAWLTSTFPVGARIVNIQRGDKGFGVVMVEGKDAVTGNPAIFVQRVLPGSTADQCNELLSGDRILAIDGQLLDGADYQIAEKYMKEAEDDVQIVLAPRTLKYSAK